MGIYYKIILFLLLFNLPIFCLCQRQYIYLIKVRTAGKTRLQTGFKTDSEKGIITALHGVIGATNFSALGANGTYNNLSIKKVDIQNDVALLSSNEIEVENLEGIQVWNSTNYSSLKGKNVKIIGHPQGIDLVINQDLTINNEGPTSQLISLIPQNIRDKINQRKSPASNIQVLVLVNGDLQPGHSGAPILFSNQIIGVGNGGLGSGALGIGWAIPFKTIQFSNYDEEIEKKLDGLPNNTMFSHEEMEIPNFPIFSSLESSGNILGDDNFMNTQVTIYANRKAKAVTTVKTNSFLYGFCGNLRIYLFDGNDNLLFETGWGSQQCVDGKINLFSKTTRTDPAFEFDIPESVDMNRIRRILIYHFPGSKQIIKLEDIEKALPKADEVETK